MRLPRASLSLLAASLLVACPPVAGPIDVEVLQRAPGDDGDYELEIVTLDSPTDITRGTGELFDVRGGLSFFGTPAADAATLEAASPDELFAITRTGGGVVDPDLFYDGSVWRARDFDSLYYLTSFAHLERAFRFVRDDAARPSGATDKKGLVSLYGNGIAAPFLPLPINLADNAAYVANADMFLVVPLVVQSEGAPPFMDEAVAVHEFHHRDFAHRVTFHDAVFPFWKELVFAHIFRAGRNDGTTDPSQAVATLLSATERRVMNEMRGMDEGLADVAAVAYSRDPDFLRAVRPDAAPARDLEGDLASLTTYQGLDDGAVPDGVREACALSAAGANLETVGMNFYCLGTIIAATLWDASGRDAETFRTVMLPAVEDGLDELAEQVALRSAEAGHLFVSTGMLFEAIATVLDAGPRASLCNALPTRFDVLLARGEVPSCF